MKLFKKILSSSLKRKNIIFGNGYSVEKSYDCLWLVDWSNSVDKKMTVKLFEDKQINYFIENIKTQNPEYFIDIGAHGGLYSIIFKNKFPYLKINSFEPDKQNRFQFYGNIFLNGFENKINVFDFGLSDQSKEVSFGIRKKGNRGGKTIQKTGEEIISVKPLDSIMSFKNKKCFIKIDVEGHESEVIEGSKKFLKNNSCFIQVEILKESGFSNFDKVMSNLGYKLINKIDDYYYSNLS